MVLKSLDEINRDFLVESRSFFGNDTAEPISIEVDIPEVEVIEPTTAQHIASQTAQQLKPDITAIRKRFTPANAPLRQREKKKRGIVAIVSDTLFYLAILVVLATSAFAGAGDGAPKAILGYSYFTVLSSSMQSEIPKGSFILVQETNPQELKLKDNITYMRDASTSVTHKIVDIYENYQNSGARGFKTQGVQNANPDKEIVYAENVVGKVVLVFPGVGALLLYLRSNIHLVFIIFGLFILLSFGLRGIFAKPKKRGVRRDINIKHLYKAAILSISGARTEKEEVALNK